MMMVVVGGRVLPLTMTMVMMGVVVTAPTSKLVVVEAEAMQLGQVADRVRDPPCQRPLTGVTRYHGHRGCSHTKAPNA
jgi:hypothetical protein